MVDLALSVRKVVVSRGQLALISELALNTGTESVDVVANALTLYETWWNREKLGFNLVAYINNKRTVRFIDRPEGRLHLVWNRFYYWWTASDFAYEIDNEDVRFRLSPILKELGISLEELTSRALTEYKELIAFVDKSDGYVYLHRASDASIDPFVLPHSQEWCRIFADSSPPFAVLSCSA